MTTYEKILNKAYLILEVCLIICTGVLVAQHRWYNAIIDIGLVSSCEWWRRTLVVKYKKENQ